MQNKVHDYVENQVKMKNIKGKCLDIGSLDVNGTLKDLFDDYLGMDMRDGKNVDVIANSHDIPFEDSSFDIVTCVEMLEHDDNPFQTMKEIHRVLRDGGWAIIAASGINFPKHDYPSDYFRYTSEGMGVLLKKFNDVETKSDENEAYGVGKK